MDSINWPTFFFFQSQPAVSGRPLLLRADVILALVEEDVGLWNLTSPLSLAIRLERNAVERDLMCNIEKNRFCSSGIPGLEMEQKVF